MGAVAVHKEQVDMAAAPVHHFLVGGLSVLLAAVEQIAHDGLVALRTRVLPENAAGIDASAHGLDAALLDKEGRVRLGARPRQRPVLHLVELAIAVLALELQSLGGIDHERASAHFAVLHLVLYACGLRHLECQNTPDALAQMQGRLDDQVRLLSRVDAQVRGIGVVHDHLHEMGRHIGMEPIDSADADDADCVRGGILRTPSEVALGLVWTPPQVRVDRYVEPILAVVKQIFSLEVHARVAAGSLFGNA